MKTLTLSILALTFLSFSIGLSAHADPYRKNYNYGYNDSYYARTNPHYGKVDSDGILSPGEIRNPLINYRDNNYGNYHKGDRHNCDFRRPYQSSGWQNYAEKKPSYNYANPLRPKPYWNPYYR